MTRVTRARLIEAIGALEACGHPVQAARIHPDGSITLLTQADPAALADPNDHGDWVSLAGETDAA